MKVLRLAFFGLLLLTVGCSSWHRNFACKGFPEGMPCMSTRDIYAFTNYRDSLSDLSAEEKRSLQQQRQPQVNGNGMGTFEAASSEGEPVRGMGYSGPVPVRSAAHLIRIWVAPWESTEGRLNLPNYIYAEVQGRRWSIGEGRLEVTPAITPLEDIGQPEAVAPRTPPRTPRRGNGAQERTPLFPEQIQRPPGQNQFNPQRQLQAQQPQSNDNALR
jgi:conjugal transfer pilus assembly protein TraV